MAPMAFDEAVADGSSSGWQAAARLDDLEDRLWRVSGCVAHAVGVSSFSWGG